MIVDTHCHAWRRWPYDTSVPDPQTRGSVDSLLYEMDRNGVDHAAIVCARIGGGQGGDGFANAENNDDVVAAATLHPDRLTAWVDVDCVWREDHHAHGAAARLQAELERTGARGFTHYVDAHNDGWLRTEEADEFFEVAERRGVIASLALGPAWFSDLHDVAASHPSLQILLHHMGTPGQGDRRTADVDALLALAACPSIGVKVSGFNYNSLSRAEYPYDDAQALFRKIVKAFGPDRLTWGSDFPASRDDLTYRQSIDVVRVHGADLGEAAVAAILGGTAERMLAASRV